MTANPQYADKPGYNLLGAPVVAVSSGVPRPEYADQPGYDSSGYPVVSIAPIMLTDTAIDHADRTVPGSLAWVLHQINQRPLAEDRKARIIMGPGVYQFNSDVVKIRDDINLVGVGVGATYLAFNAAAGGIDAGNADVYQGAHVYEVGEYVYPSGVAWPHAVRIRCITGGTSGTAGAFDTLALANTNAGNTFAEAGGVEWEVVENVTPVVGDFTYYMNSSMVGAGIKATKCNGINLLDFKALGGNPTARNVALQFDSCNQFGLGKFNAEIACNGILFNIEDVAILPYNFGDGSCSNIDITLTNSATWGVKYLASSTTSDTINNILINRMEIIGTGNVDDCQVGVWFEGAQRNTIKHLDVERCNVMVMEIGTATLRCQDNVITESHLINSGQQAIEQVSWARGLPFGQVCSTPYTVVNVRDAYLLFEPFASYVSLTTAYIADDDGTWGRNVTDVGVAAGGFTPLTMSSAIPASGRDSLARHPVLSPNTNHSMRTGLKLGVSAGEVFQLTGDEIIFPVKDTENYIAPILKMVSATQIELRSVRGQAGNLKLNTDGSIELVPLLSAPAHAAGKIAVSDGTGGGFNGIDGAGAYRSDGVSWSYLG